MELQGILQQYSVVRIEGLKITLQKKPKVSSLEVKREVLKGGEEEQCSPRKRELDRIQPDDHSMDEPSACIRLPCCPDRPYHPTRKRPLECPSLPAQSSQVTLNITVEMPPVKAARLHPMGTPPVTSANRTPKPPVAPLMKRAMRMGSFLWSRSHRRPMKHFQQSNVSVAQTQQWGPSPAP